MCAYHKVRFAVLVDNFGTCLQPQPAEVFAHQSIRNQTRAPGFNH